MRSACGPHSKLQWFTHLKIVQHRPKNAQTRNNLHNYYTIGDKKYQQLKRLSQTETTYCLAVPANIIYLDLT